MNDKISEVSNRIAQKQEKPNVNLQDEVQVNNQPEQVHIIK